MTGRNWKDLTAFRTGGHLLVACALAALAITGCTPTPPAGNDNGAGNTNDNSNGNTNENTNDNSTPAERAFAGAAVCQQCHSDAHADWASTAHAGALETLRAIAQDTNAVCLPCHTVGFGQTGGYVDEATTADLAGVQCENCHGAAGAHTRNPGDASLRPKIDNDLLSAQVCGACHNDAHHPTYEEWQLSKHGNALAGLLANSFKQDSCLECHSQDYRYAIETGSDTVPTVDTAELSLECSTCHAPHGNTGQPRQLRAAVADLCGECHTQEEATIGETPHHPQLEMLTGAGAYNADGDPFTRVHSHSSLAASGGAACAQCHVVQFEVEEPNEGNPNVTGHTFNPFDESITTNQAAPYTGCTLCHDAATAEELRTEEQAEIESRLAALAPLFDATSPTYIDPATLSEADAARLATAKFNYQFVAADGSRGVHNPAYANAVLEVAEEIVSPLTSDE